MSPDHCTSSINDFSVNHQVQKRTQAVRAAKLTPKKLARIDEEGDDSDRGHSTDEIEDDSDFEA